MHLTKPMKLHCHILLAAGVIICQTSMAQGLKFSGSEHHIDKRTSYDVFHGKQMEFTGSFDIEFDLALYPETRIGYILRIKNSENGKVYNLFYDGQGDIIKFNFNEEGKSCLMDIRLEQDKLPDRQWIGMNLSLDLATDSVRLTVNGNTFAVGNVELSDRYRPAITFGRSDHIIDVPSFAIRTLSVGNNRKSYRFPLNEHKGNVVHSSKGKAVGWVVNPEWLINDAFHWRFETAFASQTVAGANYNPNSEDIYYFNRDTLIIYNVRSRGTTLRTFENRCPVELKLGTNFIDPVDNKLYAYEVFDNSSHQGPMVASLDLETLRWSVESYDHLPTQLHHHGSFFDPKTRRYTIFGGFGNMRYDKDFHTYDLATGRWNTVEGLTGDIIFPRYFSSVGYCEETGSAYVFGGMGNESGQQIVGRNYYYDLHRVDFNDMHITKMWELPWSGRYLVPVRGMIIPDNSCFYTLCYPEHFTDSFLRLYKFALKDGNYDVLGDSIPIYSDRITTNANLYYNDGLKNLYVTVQEFADDISSDLKVYSLAYPPITAADLTEYVRSNDRDTMLAIIILVSCVCLGVAGYFIFRRISVRRSGEPEPGVPQGFGDSRMELFRPNSVSIFGDFMVRDRNNKDITYMFSTRLKQTFCLILQYSGGEGITSQRLSSLLWPDKPEDKVKNSRGVTINHLRKALSELDGIELVYEKGCFKLVQSDGFYCDYMRCVNIISSNKGEENIDELVALLTRGKFLKFSDEPMFDSFKEEVEHKLEPVLLFGMKKSYEEEAYQTTLDLAQSIFNIDPLNDEALTFQIRAMQRLKMNEEAQIRYQTFIIDYKKMMGNDYPRPFKEIV